MINMFPSSKRSSLFILGVTAVIFSRALFFFFDDPEGPNVLVVMVAAAIVYVGSLAAYTFGSSTVDSKKFWLAILLQMVFVVGLYFLGVNF